MIDDEPVITLEERFPTTLRYQPHRDRHWNVKEDESEYIQRMLAGPLSHWPRELLKEWIFRHADQMEDYAFVGFEKLQFESVTWAVDRIPGREAFRDESFCDSFQDVETRAELNKFDWLAHYMLKVGTWNTPIVLFDNRSLVDVRQEPLLKSPYHLLEGHRRLSFLQGLKRLNKALPEHALWIAQVPAGDLSL